MGIWTLFTDGSSHFSRIRLWIIIKLPKGDIILQAVSCGFDETNNEVEHEALIRGLQLVKDLQIKDV